MTIFGMKITGGPNLNFYLVTCIFFFLSWQSGNWWIFGGYLGVLVTLLPLCLWIAVKSPQWEKAEQEKLVRDFPYDMEIQAKYNPEWRAKNPHLAKLMDSMPGKRSRP